ncbi:MAG: undecaprenyl-diphosphate phosphatase [Angustibacter sp.]
MSDLSYPDAVLLGVVEGLTEFLPVSSTGHLTITEGLLGLDVDSAAITGFTATIQVGAIFATLLYFGRDITRLARAWVRGLRSHRARRDPDYRLAWYVIFGSMPLGIVGFLLRNVITGPLRSLWVVAGALIAWSGVMWLGERLGRQERDEDQLSASDVLIIGLVQCCSLVPGVSRSGATISAGLLRGLDRVTATRLSFFLAIPALTAAGLFELRSVDTDVVGIGPLLMGTAVSFLVALASIAWLLRFVARHPITVFIWYRVALGIAVAILLSTGILNAT